MNRTVYVPPRPRLRPRIRSGSMFSPRQYNAIKAREKRIEARRSILCLLAFFVLAAIGGLAWVHALPGPR